MKQYSPKMLTLPVLLIIVFSIFRSNFSFAYVDLMDYGKSGNTHRQKILDMHNMLRSYEAGGAWGGGAVYMLRLVYDMGLEAYAKTYARKLCSTGHWGHSKRSAPNRVAPGENLYVNTIDYSGRDPLEFDGSVVVKKWWDERKYFDWHAVDPSKKAKSMNQMIGHYTQVVRAEASAVGCWIITGCQCKGRRSCGKENNPPYWSTYMACHYDFGNQGWFPYWPVGIPSKIPASIPAERRRRCGNCPRGFNACGTTAGHLNPKRDAYLCVGYWDKSKQLPSPTLLSESIKQRKELSLPSWSHMMRFCKGNGGCPNAAYAGGASCWDYKKGSLPVKEPTILFQQCLCESFSTKNGVWFQRDSCVIHNKQDYSQPLTRYGVLQLGKTKRRRRRSTSTKYGIGAGRRKGYRKGQLQGSQLGPISSGLLEAKSMGVPAIPNDKWDSAALVADTENIWDAVAKVESSMKLYPDNNIPNSETLELSEIETNSPDTTGILVELLGSTSPEDLELTMEKTQESKVNNKSSSAQRAGIPPRLHKGAELRRHIKTIGKGAFIQNHLTQKAFHPVRRFLRERLKMHAPTIDSYSVPEADVVTGSDNQADNSESIRLDSEEPGGEDFPPELNEEHDLTDAAPYA